MNTVRIHILFLFSLLSVLTMMAVPAKPGLHTITQPDGSILTIQLIGDEYYHYNATADGYTIVKNGVGVYEYAVLDGNRLVASGKMAHDASMRSDEERLFLSQVGRNLRSASRIKEAKQRRAEISRQQHREPVINYEEFRGLVVLINFNDKKFGMENPNEFYHQMLNARDYHGFTHEGQFQQCTGSVRDYFFDNSSGIFDPYFDVIGPVEVDYSCYECAEKSSDIFRAALNSIDDQVDFTQYDADEDETIDMVFFLVAGYGANYVGNDSGYLWPHMSALFGYDEQEDYYYYLVYDNMYMWTYASSCEITGWEDYGSTMPDGIGTFCHEFSHVIGLPDLYDTDYELSGGDSNHPGIWSVMAGGSYNNSGRTPVAYTIYERYAMGFAEPRVIDEPGDYSLDYVGSTGDGLILHTPVEGEFFMLDNRQMNKWDTYLPYHGMTVWRVDSTDAEPWWYNEVNNNPEHNYFEMLRAGGSNLPNSYDPFPGIGEVTVLSPNTFPALVTWANIPVEKTIKNIKETDGVITFTVKNGVETLLPGDVNEDGEVSIADVNVLIEFILSSSSGYEDRADINQDEEITIADLNELIEIIITQ